MTKSVMKGCASLCGVRKETRVGDGYMPVMGNVSEVTTVGAGEEQWLSIDLTDGKRAHGLFCEVPGAPVVVMAHGLGMSYDCHPLPAASYALSAAGYSSYRFNFYDFSLDARRLFDTTIESMAHDLDTVVAHFRRTHEAVNVVGHSMGGIVVLSSMEQTFDCAVTWDGGTPERKRWEELPQHWTWREGAGEPGFWTPASGVQYMVSNALPSSQAALDGDALYRSFRRPLKVIMSGAADGLGATRRHLREMAGAAELVEMPGADHGYTMRPHADLLFEETIEWLQRHGTP